jgi:hypothetical protein
MRFAALVTVLLMSAPAFAQTPQTPAKDAPPPEGFYRDVPNAYDLLLRPQAYNPLTMINGRRILPECPKSSTLSDTDKAIRRAHSADGTESLYQNADGDLKLCAIAKSDMAKGN